MKHIIHDWGFTLTRIAPTQSPLSIIEARPK
jgi:hypothetical protein